jgi:hypothetical protein
MDQTVEVKKPEKRAGEKYHEPLLIKHEPLMDITGQKYSEKYLAEKETTEKTALD